MKTQDVADIFSKGDPVIVTGTAPNLRNFCDILKFSRMKYVVACIEYRNYGTDVIIVESSAYEDIIHQFAETCNLDLLHVRIYDRKRFNADLVISLVCEDSSVELSDIGISDKYEGDADWWENSFFAVFSDTKDDMEANDTIIRIGASI